MCGGWTTQNVIIARRCDLWKEYKSRWDRFACYIICVAEDGTKVRFWHDICCGDIPLKELYPNLYSLVVDKDVLVYSLERLVGGTPSWNIKCVGGFNDLESE